MTWVSIIAMIFTGCGLVISIIALLQSKKANDEAKKANKAAMRQNLEQEQAEIDRELADIAVQIRRDESAGREQMSKVYGYFGPNPREKEIKALLDKCNVLTNRRAKINKQLEQL